MLIVSVISSLLVAVCIAYSAKHRRQTSPIDCLLPSTNGKGKEITLRPADCCKLPLFEQSKQVEICEAKFTPAPPYGPRALGIPSTMSPHEFACFDECVVRELGHLTEDSKLDKEKIVKHAKVLETALPLWANAISEGVSNCIDKDYNVTINYECTSGAMEYRACLTRQMFLNCPKSLWTSSDECTEIKSKVEKCPFLTVRA